jgi:hypothetical protein
MPLKSPPYLTLVWPPVASAEDPGDFSYIQEQALKNDGWRFVSHDDLQHLAPDTWACLTGVLINGRMTLWLKDVPKTPPARALTVVSNVPSMP